MTALRAVPEQGSGDEKDPSALLASRTDPWTFTSLFDDHFGSLHGYLRRRLGEPLAEELAAETFTRAFDARDRYDPEAGSVRAWLYGIAANLVRDHFRAESRRLRAYARAAGRAERHQEPPGDERADASAAMPRVAAALSALRPEEREALLLFAWADLGYEEIAAAVGVPVGTVRSRLSRGRRQIQTLLEEDGHDG